MKNAKQFFSTFSMHAPLCPYRIHFWGHGSKHGRPCYGRSEGTKYNLWVGFQFELHSMVVNFGTPQEPKARVDGLLLHYARLPPFVNGKEAPGWSSPVSVTVIHVFGIGGAYPKRKHDGRFCGPGRPDICWEGTHRGMDHSRIERLPVESRPMIHARGT